MALLPHTTESTRKRALIFFGGTFVLLGLVFWLLARWISPAPPSQVDMTTGAIDGASHQFALQYQALLKANGVTLRLLPSSGSLENLQRLQAGTPAGFVQSGLMTLGANAPDGDADQPLRSLGVVGYEPEIGRAHV